MKIKYEIINHGVQSAQYFQGCGRGRYDDVETGIGGSAYDALEDALDMLAQNDWEVDEIENHLSKEITAEGDEIYHYLSVRIARDSESE